MVLSKTLAVLRKVNSRRVTASERALGRLRLVAAPVRCVRIEPQAPTGRREASLAPPADYQCAHAQPRFFGTLGEAAAPGPPGAFRRAGSVTTVNTEACGSSRAIR
jgi:hypothetical protein